jgi:hypothetical protein
MNKLNLIFHTIRHLRLIQIHYQLWYRIRRDARHILGIKYQLIVDQKSNQLKLENWIDKTVSYWKSIKTFQFLNLSKEYSNSLNWNESCYGKLWSYNLNYMDYLIQKGMDEKTGIELIQQFINDLPLNRIGLEPYPIALRGINWIKFLNKFSISNPNFSGSLYAQYRILFNNLEYHLLGNHLLEDGFSLLFGAFYFEEKKWYKKAIKIIEKELNEQILNDGAHFELSPMYHQIILERLLDCLNLIQNNHMFKGQEALRMLLNTKAIKMIQWLNFITFSNGSIPLLNDSANGIAPTTEQLNKYALRLGLTSQEPLRGNNLNPSNLFESGYRRFNTPNYECIVDIGEIGPSYQPGHAHADTFNFVLNLNNEPFIVDTGISTYEANKIRLDERGTAAHNTVTVNNKNSSTVWSSFRVAKRAKVTIIKDEPNIVIAEHGGYKNISVIHQRSWHFSDENITISDEINGNSSEAKAHFWLSPQIRPTIKDNQIYFQQTEICFENAKDIQIIKTQIPNGYNKFNDNYKIEVGFKSHLKTYISIKH